METKTGSSGTPVPSRAYFNVGHGVHHSPRDTSGTPQQIQETNSLASEDGGKIYGTTISAKHVAEQLERFIMEFEVGGESGLAEKVYYVKLLDLDVLETATLEVSGLDLKEFDREVYYQLVYFPAEMISLFDHVLKTLYQRLFVEAAQGEAAAEKRAKKERLMVDVKHLDALTFIRQLGPRDINRLVSFRGIAIRASDLHPEMKQACFRCASCARELAVPLENAKLQQPAECPNRACAARHSMQLVHNLSDFTDKQYVKFQELLEYVPDGETPHAITLISYDSNVDGFRPGDRVEVVGIYRAHSPKLHRHKNAFRTLFATYVDLISFRLLDHTRFQAHQALRFTDEERDRFLHIASRPTVLDDLVASFAPSIFANEDVKKGLLAQLFAGTPKDSLQGASFRHDLNICLVGDPSTAKSQLLQQVYKIAPRGVYTSGRGSSAVGLTANVRKDPETREFILESGALVLSDLGVCCIDEFDKMAESSRTILLEAMEQQTISIAKAGIVAQLNTRTAILAAANPVNSRYDATKTVVDNINLPPALLSRFDLIYILLDVAREDQDRSLAHHILSLYAQSPSKAAASPEGVQRYSRETLARYITFARQTVHPVIPEQVARKIIEIYLEMRQLGLSRKIISATPRQLESLIRLSEAFAKMRLSREVGEEDVEQAIKLIKVALQESATDKETGLIDMDCLVTGKTASSKRKVGQVVRFAKDYLRANSDKYQKLTSNRLLFDEIMRHMDKLSLLDKEMEDVLNVLEADDLIVRSGNTRHKMSFRLKREVDFK